MAKNSKNPAARGTGLWKDSFIWNSMPSNATGTAQLNWQQRRNAAQSNVDWSRADYKRGAAQVRTDTGNARTAQRYNYNQQKTDAGLNAAGSGLGRNPAFLGKELQSLANDNAATQADIGLQKRRQVAALQQLVRDAQRRRQLENDAMTLEYGLYANPADIIKGVL